MDYNEFLQEIEARVRDRMAEGSYIGILSVPKNNGVVMDGLVILEQEANVAPTIYLNQFYREYRDGETMDRIVNRILHYYWQGKRMRKLDTSFYTDFGKAGGRIVCRVINREKNRKLLEEIPNRPFLNLAMVYYYLMEQTQLGSGSILVRNQHMRLWGVEAMQLHELAVKNTKALLPGLFQPMMDLIAGMGEKGVGREKLPLYVLSNQKQAYGAFWMTDPATLKKIGAELGQDYYVLPSSVHECIVVPADIGACEKELAEMVREINTAQVEPEEVLSDCIYYYDREAEEIRMVQEAEGGSEVQKARGDCCG